METKNLRVKLPTITEKPQYCSFNGYDAVSLKAETAKLRRLITKRGTLEIPIPLRCTTDPVRYMKFRQSLLDLQDSFVAKLYSIYQDIYDPDCIILFVQTVLKDKILSLLVRSCISSIKDSVLSLVSRHLTYILV
jgi:hypothetical protein